MLVSISTRHGTLTEQNRAKLEMKVEKFGRLFENITAINITVDLEDKARLQVDLLASLKNQPEMIASFQAGELFAAMDGAVHKLEQQLRKSKGKTIDRYHAGPNVELPGELPDPPAKPAAEPVAEALVETAAEGE